MRNKLFINILIPVIIILAVSSAYLNNNSNPQEDIAVFTEGSLELHFIDVGQGDSMLAKLPNNTTMLIDAGSNSKSGIVLQYLKDNEVQKIDMLIATHPHEDHIGSMDEVIYEFEIGDIYMPKVSATTKAFENLLTAIKDKNLKVNSAKGGMILHDEDGLKIEFTAPNSDSYTNTNDYSAVTKITYGSTSFLLTGDAENRSENEMLERNYNLKSDVLKVGHHGSKTSSSLGFLKAVSPQIGIISSGRGNSDNHTAEETLENLENHGINIYRTDELGTIVVISDGTNIKVVN